MAVKDIILVLITQLKHVIDSHGGYVLKYVGDAVISFFLTISTRTNILLQICQSNVGNQ
jgi:class 3 adenylate cyclase